MGNPIIDRKSVDNKPGIVIIGSPNVGKRTILSRGGRSTPSKIMQMLVCGWPPSDECYSAIIFSFHLLECLKIGLSHNDIHKFEILLYIGNKVDLLPNHSAHIEYRGHLLKCAESSGSRMELDSGISETEGSGLLGDDDLSLEVKRSCWDWCIGHNIECIEACAANADFDKCLSLPGC